jgi:hypothetical protein
LEERPLGLEFFHDRFHHHVTGRKRLGGVDDLDAADGLVGLGGAEAAFLDELAEGLPDRFFRLARRPRLGVEEERAGAALRHDLRDAAAHGAGACHAGDEVAAVGI